MWGWTVKVHVSKCGRDKLEIKAYFDYKDKKWGMISDLKNYLAGNEVVYVVFTPADGKDYLRIKLGYCTMKAFDNTKAGFPNFLKDVSMFQTSLRIYLSTKLEINNIPGAGFFYAMLSDLNDFKTGIDAEDNLRKILLNGMGEYGLRSDKLDNIESYSTSLEYFRYYRKALDLHAIWQKYVAGHTKNYKKSVKI